MYNDEAYVYSFSTLSTNYPLHLSDNSIDTKTGRHVQNLKDSTIKGAVDDWYEENILGKLEESLLEDTVWCNDRNVISENHSIENFVSKNSRLTFASYTRLGETITATPSLVCSRDMDKFTVESSNGNGDLTYPIGLLTADEINLAGDLFSNSSTTYLNVSEEYWSLSPGQFFQSMAYMIALSNNKLYNNYFVTGTYGARPAISINNSVTISSGDGSFEKPYVIG